MIVLCQKLKLLSSIVLMTAFAVSSVFLQTSAQALEIDVLNNSEESDPIGQTDSLESYNRSMHSLNQSLDENVIEPTAQMYHDIVPDPVESGVSNFFDNLGEPLNVFHNLLQGKPVDALSSLTRFGFNSTIGLYGILDVATPMGIEVQEEDFGQTLAVWGVGTGPYIVLPILGPSTMRDAVGFTADHAIGNNFQIGNRYAFNGIKEIQKHGHSDRGTILYAAKILSIRTDLLDEKELLDNASFDDYSFIRDAYLQNRRNEILDGNAPLEVLPAELFE